MPSNKFALERALERFVDEGIILRWRRGTEFYGYIYIDLLGRECFIMMDEIYQDFDQVIANIMTDWQELRWRKAKQDNTLARGEHKSDEKLTKKQINDELDIIRGRIPTPKGYKIDPDRTKWLMKRLKEMRKK